MDRNCLAGNKEPFAMLSGAQFKSAPVSAIELLPERETPRWRVNKVLRRSSCFIRS